MSIKHHHWLKKTAQSLSTADGQPIEVWELVPPADDAAGWSSWARHFRQHYCPDHLIDKLKAGTEHKNSRRDYLIALVFPDETQKPGPSIRSGDFAEILLADLFEFHLSYWIPRTQYQEKAVRNEAVKGTDVVGFKLSKMDGSFSAKDELVTVESKAQLTGTKPKPVLQKAVNDCAKDEFRKSQTLNAIKRRFIERGQDKEAQVIERFQDAQARPYRDLRVAGAVICNNAYDPKHISTTTSNHITPKPTQLLVIRGEQLMKLVHKLFKLAADEA